MVEEEKRILILTADAGMGHRSAAEAVRYAIKNKYSGQYTLMIENPLDHPKVPELFRRSQSDYDEIVKRLPELYEMGFKASNSTLPVTLMEAGFIAGLYEAIRDLIHKHKPDLILTTYPIYQAPIHAVSVINKLQIPLITVVTDLVTVHHVWFNTSVARCVVPTVSVGQRALKAGLTQEQINIIGIPVDPRIIDLKAIDKRDIRKDLGWDQDRLSLLVVGSPRIKGLMDIVKLIDHSGYDLQMALVAGGDTALYESFQETDWHHPVYVYEFVDFMPKFMRAADMIVCKAGGLIVTESLASGLPLMLVHALPGQEIGNVDFVVKNQAGRMCKTPGEILETFSHWLANGHARLNEIAQNASDSIPGDSAYQIADIVFELLCQPAGLVKERESASLRELLDGFNISSQ